MRPTRHSYALAATGVLAIEIAIALFVRDRLVRPYVGDSLAVVLVYLSLRAATPLRMPAAIAGALAVAVAVELGQLLGLLDALGLAANPVARVLLGTGFEAWDFAAYGAGALLVILVETLRPTSA